MNEQELQQAFIQYLAQKTGAKTQQELEKVIPEKRKAAIELYHRARKSGIKWDNMGWTE